MVKERIKEERLRYKEKIERKRQWERKRQIRNRAK
jgi:hypothetical protein